MSRITEDNENMDFEGRVHYACAFVKTFLIIVLGFIVVGCIAFINN